MSKYEFLNDLKASLIGNVSGQIINENMQYYDEYIAGEVRKGKTESEILNELGDPRLIARTIIDTKGDNTAQSTYADESWEEDRGTGYSGYNTDNKRRRENTPKSKGIFNKQMSEETARKIRMYLIIALALILIVLILGFVLTAAAALFYIFWPVVLVLFIVHLMTRNNRYD